jgi:galactoside O-acetyltransferase
MNSSFYSRDELFQLGLRSFGENVLISRFARFYGPESIEIGNNVRIDDFCILSGTIKLGNFIHISAYSALYGKFGIEMEDFTGLSPKCTIFSATDDFGGDFLIGPMINKKFTNVIGGKVIIKKYSQIGCNCVILPSVTINEGAAIGTMSLVNKDVKEWSIYKGIPSRFYKFRSREMLDFNINEK